jgi:hypothetical protein
MFAHQEIVELEYKVKENIRVIQKTCTENGSIEKQILESDNEGKMEMHERAAVLGIGQEVYAAGYPSCSNQQSRAGDRASPKKMVRPSNKSTRFIPCLSSQSVKLDDSSHLRLNAFSQLLIFVFEIFFFSSSSRIEEKLS